MIASARLGSWTPASSIAIWSVPCLRISGSETPSLSTRDRMIETERSRSVAVSLWPGGGWAFSTTSSPPCRSRPERRLLVEGRAGDREQRDADDGGDHSEDEEEV